MNSEVSELFVGFMDSKQVHKYKIKCNGQELSAENFPNLYQFLVKVKQVNASKFYDTYQDYEDALDSSQSEYKFFFNSEKICLPKFGSKDVFITYDKLLPSEDAITLDQSVQFNDNNEITSSEIQFSFQEPDVESPDQEVLNNLKVQDLDRNSLVIDRDTSEQSISLDGELQGSTNYEAKLTQYIDDAIDMYSKVQFKTAPEAPFSISEDQITLRQGDSINIPFTNDGCTITTSTEFGLVNVTQNSNGLALRAVTNDNGSDHITITASKNGYMNKVFSITIIVPDVHIESNLLAVTINGPEDYKDITVTTNGDDISYLTSNGNCKVVLINSSQDNLTKVFRVTGLVDGGSVITFNSLVDGVIVETCTCGVSITNMIVSQVAFTTSSSGSNIDFFTYSTNFNTSDYDVYINGNKTSQIFNSLTFNANDRIQIKANKNVSFYPRFNANNKNYIRSIDDAFPLMSGDNTNATTSFYKCFFECSALTSIPSNLFVNNPSIYTVELCFAGCSSLTSIPSDLFRYNINIDNATSCFSMCTSLISVPSNIFQYSPQLEYVNGCFYRCSSITSNVPELWNTHPKTKKTHKHDQTFFGCTNAANYASIPSDWIYLD